MAFPSTPLDVQVSLALSADLSDPSSWTWTDITTYVRVEQRIRIRRGRSGERSTMPPSRCTLTVDNTDGRFCRFLPTGAWYGQLGKNTPLRVRINNGSGYVTRFVGYVSGWPPSWDPSENNQMVSLSADGILRRLGQSPAVRSPLFKTMSGITPDDVVPLVYWPGEDSSDATEVASGLANGLPMAVSGNVSFAANSNLAGSAPLATLSAGATLSGAVPAYTDIGKWFINVALMIPSEPSATTTVLEVRTTGGSVAYWRLLVVPGSPTQLQWQAYDTTGTALTDVNEILTLDGSGGGRPTEADFYGNWFMYVLGSVQRNSTQVGGSAGMTNTGTFVSVGGFQNTGTHSAIRYIRVMAQSGTDGLGVGHLGLFTSSAFVESTGSNQNASAMLAHVGEMAHDRFQRLCDEEGIAATVTASTSQPMGPQPIDKLVKILQDCAFTDYGLFYEPLDAGVAFLSSSERTNQSAAITLDYSLGQVAPPWNPVDDDRDFANVITASQPTGTSRRIADEDSVAAVGIYELPVTANTETADQLGEVGGWALNLGLIDELRWPAIVLNLRANPTLIDAWLATDLADQLHVINHPSPLAPDTIRQIIDGYEEVLGPYEYMVNANVSPASGWDVAELDDADSARLDTDGAYLSSAATSSGTTFQVATTTGTSPLWTTSGGEVPFPLWVGGEEVTATAVAAPTTITYGAVGTATHASNASVTPGIPASVAAGNLLIVVAAIRNSGTGVPDTPSGYSRLPVFASTDNVQVFAKVAVGGDVAPTITFTGGVANATTSAQMIRIAGAFSDPDDCFVAGQAQLNSSAQNIDYPALLLTWPAPEVASCFVVYLGWKQDDFTSVATISGATEIAEASSTTGDDQSLVWDYVIQTTATNVKEGSFTVTGGASAISRGAVFAIRSNIQAVTVTRGVNGVTKSQTANTAVTGYQFARLAL